MTTSRTWYSMTWLCNIKDCHRFLQASAWHLLVEYKARDVANAAPATIAWRVLAWLFNKSFCETCRCCLKNWIVSSEVWSRVALAEVRAKVRDGWDIHFIAEKSSERLSEELHWVLSAQVDYEVVTISMIIELSKYFVGVSQPNFHSLFTTASTKLPSFSLGTRSHPPKGSSQRPRNRQTETRDAAQYHLDLYRVSSLSSRL